jgi:phosphoribosylanthranilate isomerase
MQAWNEFQYNKLQTYKNFEEPVLDMNIVLIEPRKHPAFKFTVYNLLTNVRAPLIVVHGTKNEEFVKNICKDLNVKYINCGKEDLPPKDYNALMKDASFLIKLGKYVLIAQTDALFLKPATDYFKKLLEDPPSFLGAPWAYTCQVCQAPLTGGCGHMIDQAIVCTIPEMVGNGGLSFRNVHDMIAVLNDKNTAINEDVFYCKAFSGKFKMPTRLEAMEFCIEQVPPISWPPTSYACHKPYGYLPAPLVKGILEYYK